MEIAFTIAGLLLPLSGFYFWGRGVVKSSKGDLVLGFSVLALTFVLEVVVSRTSAIFSEVGILAVIFGIETLFVSAFAKSDCPMSRTERTALGIGALVVGAVFSLVV